MGISAFLFSSAYALARLISTDPNPFQASRLQRMASGSMLKETRLALCCRLWRATETLMSIQKQRIFGISSLASVALVIFAHSADAADVGLITKLSSHSAKDTVERFESAVRAKVWIVFTEIDHAGAAKQVGLDMKPRPLFCLATQNSARRRCRRAGHWLSIILLRLLFERMIMERFGSLI